MSGTAAHHIIGDCRRLLEEIEGLPPSGQRRAFADWVNQEGWDLGLDEELFADARELTQAEEREAHQEARADQAEDRADRLEEEANQLRRNVSDTLRDALREGDIDSLIDGVNELIESLE